jgi:serine protease Do
MSRAGQWTLMGLAGLLGLAIGIGVREELGPGRATPQVPLASFADVVARVNPAVVQVVTLDNATPPTLLGAEPGPGPQWRGDGAGFLVDPAGLVLTNAHLVEYSDRVRVRLGDGREWQAELVGADVSTDLALLRVAASRLPAVPMGDSDRLRVGDWVCAIGNPFRFAHSVTVGVVSSKGRKIFDASFDAYIQTDAAINPGNSGGPLINTAGEAVGVSAAVSRQGQGIGFAIPINVARDVLQQLITRGRVSRGFLGIQLDDLDRDLASLLGAPGADGALVLDVYPGRAGDGAGLHRYDVIRGVSGTPVADSTALIRIVSGALPGTEVTLDVLRDGRRIPIRATLGERESRSTGAPGSSPWRSARRSVDADALGLSVAQATSDELRGVPADKRGVVVRGVWSLAAGADDLERGDLVVQVDRRPTGDLEAYRAVVGGLAPGSPAWLYRYRPRARSVALVKLEVEVPEER